MKKIIGIYDEYDFPPNYDARSHDLSFLRGVCLFIGSLVVLYLIFG